MQIFFYLSNRNFFWERACSDSEALSVLPPTVHHIIPVQYSVCWFPLLVNSYTVSQGDNNNIECLPAARQKIECFSEKKANFSASDASNKTTFTETTVLDASLRNSILLFYCIELHNLYSKKVWIHLNTLFTPASFLFYMFGEKHIFPTF